MKNAGTVELKLPPRAIVYLVAGLGGILIFIFVILVPRQKQLSALDREIQLLSDKIEAQSSLLPFYTALKKKETPDAVTGLPLTETEELVHMDIRQISDLFQKMASESHLQLDEIRPDFNSLEEDANDWRFYLALTGNFFDFRTFLVRLGALPYLNQVEYLTLQTLSASEKLRLKLKLSLVQEK